MKIIDVSHWQGAIDWAKVRKSGVDVAIIKCTEGTGYFDPTFIFNKSEARKNGILLGYYHFANGRDPLEESQCFLNRVGDIQEGELIALDWEIEHSDPDGWCKRWLDSVSGRVGFKPILYTNADRVKRIDWKEVAGGNYGLWIARYGDNDDKAEDNEIPNTDEWKYFAIWQYSSKGRVDGISGYVDLDTTTMDLETLKKYGRQPFYTTTPEQKCAPYTPDLLKRMENIRGKDYGNNLDDKDLVDFVDFTEEQVNKKPATVTVEKPIEKIVEKYVSVPEEKIVEKEVYPKECLDLGFFVICKPNKK